MKKIINFILNLLFPDDVACKACDQECKVNAYGLCAKCAAGLEYIQHACIKCGKKLEQAGRCKECGKAVHFFDRCISVCLYNPVSAKLVKGLKFGNQRHIAPKLALMMFEKWSDLSLEADLVLGVPMHPKNKRKRGYNQSVLIAKHFAELSGVAYSEVLHKVRQTAEQVGLNRAERLTNLKDAFAVTEGADLTDKRILVIDDVFTTGATMNACAEALKKAGAKRVYGLTFLSGEMK